MTPVHFMVQRHCHFSSPFIGDRQWVPAVNLTKTRSLYWPCFEVEDLHAGVDVHTADVPHGVVDSLPGEQVVRVQPAPGRLADEAGRGPVRRLHRHPRAESRDSHSQISPSSHFCLLRKIQEKNGLLLKVQFLVFYWLYPSYKRAITPMFF